MVVRRHDLEAFFPSDPMHDPGLYLRARARPECETCNPEQLSDWLLV